MSVYKETIADIKKIRELAEKSAYKKLAEEAAPRIKSLIDKKINSINEQQLNALDPAGFPYETEQISAPGNMQIPSVNNTQQLNVPVNSVAVPQINSQMAFSQSIPQEQPQGPGVLLDLDAVAAEIMRLMSTPEVPREQALPVNTAAAAPLETVLDTEEVVNSEMNVLDSESGEGNEDDVIKFMDKTKSDSETFNQEQEEKLELPVSSEESDKNVIYIEPDLRKESKSFDIMETLNRLGGIEQFAVSFIEDSEPLTLVKSVKKAEGTLRDLKTLKEEIKNGFAQGNIESKHFSGLYEISSHLEEKINEKISKLNSVEFSLEDAKGGDSKIQKTERKNETFILEIDEKALSAFGGGKKVHKKEILKNKQTGTMKSNKVVYEFELEEGKKDQKTDNKLMEESEMARRLKDDEVLEISEADLLRALKGARLNEQVNGEEMHFETDGGDQPDPAVDDELGDELLALLEPEDVAVHELEDGGDYAETATMPRADKAVAELPPAMASQLRHEVAQLRKANKELTGKLDEAMLTNAKLIHANKFIYNKNLTLEEKRKVARMFDRAETIRDVEFVASTLSENFSVGAKATTLKEGQVRPGASSRVTTSAAPAQSNDNTELQRMRELAGIRK